jgi:hypothetical protein
MVHGGILVDLTLGAGIVLDQEPVSSDGPVNVAAADRMFNP